LIGADRFPESRRGPATMDALAIERILQDEEEVVIASNFSPFVI
jgi:hypothetical protein